MEGETRLRHQWNHLEGFHEVEFWKMPGRLRGKQYPKAPYRWRDIEVTRWMPSSTPPVLSYFGSRLLHRGASSLLMDHWQVGVLDERPHGLLRLRQTWCLVQLS